MRCFSRLCFLEVQPPISDPQDQVHHTCTMVMAMAVTRIAIDPLEARIVGHVGISRWLPEGKERSVRTVKAHAFFGVSVRRLPHRVLFFRSRLYGCGYEQRVPAGAMDVENRQAGVGN